MRSAVRRSAAGRTRQAARRIVFVVAVLGGASAPLGCTAALPALTKVASVVMDAMVVLDVIDGGVREWFRVHPNAAPEVQREYDKLFVKAQLALNAAQQAVAGSRDLSQQDYDAAFASFRQAYIDLVNLLHREGIAQNNAMMSADGSTVAIPEPLALEFRVER